EPSTSAATDLAALATGRSRLVRAPLVRSTLFVSGAAALACNLALLLGCHRSEAPPLFFLCTHGCPLPNPDCRLPIGWMPTAAVISSSMPGIRCKSWCVRVQNTLGPASHFMRLDRQRIFCSGSLQ